MSHPRTTIDYKIKLIIIGDSEVGKTCMVTNFLQDSIFKTYIPTVEKTISTHPLVLKKKNVQLKLWDFSGADIYRTLTAAQYSGAQGAIIVYSRTDIESFLHVENWMKSLSMYHENVNDGSLKIIVVGSKSDSPKVCITKEKGDMVTENLGFKHFVGSAYQKNSFESAFAEIITQILDETQRQEKEEALQQSLSDNDLTKALLGGKQQEQVQCRTCPCQRCILL